jgi:ribosomal protein S18 acetylase RimI-like enzyme
MVRIREMRADDVDAVAAVRVRGWQAAYVGMLPQAYLDRMSVAEDAARRRGRFAASRGRVCNLVAVDAADAVVGWASLGPWRGPDAAAAAGAGEVYALYVRPELVGTGVGRALLDAVHEEAARRRMPELLLWVLRDNARARRFYARQGYVCDGATQSDDYDGVTAVEVRYRRALRDGPPPGSRMSRDHGQTTCPSD